jgi:hypothetical protein
MAIDASSNQKGRLTVESHSSATTGTDLRISYQYDVHGRVVARKHAMDGHAFGFTTTYGDANGVVRPDGPLVVGRPSPMASA